MSGPTRPALRWYGAKWKMAEKILAHLPPHRVYVEPFGGGASILLRKARTYAEVYNDLDKEAVNLFRVLQRPESAAALLALLEVTPFAKEEFELSYEPTEEPVELARRLLIRSLMGFGSNGHNVKIKTGFRSNSSRSGTTPAHDWVSYRDALPAIIARLDGVVIENKDACAVMAQHDAPTTLHYVDPPYMWSTRSMLAHRGSMYAHEMSDNDHARLLDYLNTVEGMVVLSGYPHPLYDKALRAWRRVEFDALADGARKRKEILWINPAATAALDAARVQPGLFAGCGA